VTVNELGVGANCPVGFRILLKHRHLRHGRSRAALLSGSVSEKKLETDRGARVSRLRKIRELERSGVGFNFTILTMKYLREIGPAR
jgi:hypothetical protein